MRSCVGICAPSGCDSVVVQAGHPQVSSISCESTISWLEALGLTAAALRRCDRTGQTSVSRTSAETLQHASVVIGAASAWVLQQAWWTRSQSCLSDSRSRPAGLHPVAKLALAALLCSIRRWFSGTDVPAGSKLGLDVGSKKMCFICTPRKRDCSRTNVMMRIPDC